MAKIVKCTGLWTLIGGLIGITVVAIIATMILSKRRLKSRDSPKNEGNPSI